MDRTRRLILSRLALACPICVTPAGTAMASGVQAGALVLILIAVAVLVPIVRFGWRVWKLEQGLQSRAGEPSSRVQTPVTSMQESTAR